jgi:hypothetical protein
MFIYLFIYCPIHLIIIITVRQGGSSNPKGGADGEQNSEEVQRKSVAAEE